MQSLQMRYNPRSRNLDPVEGVNWGNQATLRLVSGPTYQQIELVTDITNASDIERVMLKQGSKEVVNVTGQDLIDIQEHRKQFTEAGRFVLSFADETMRTKAGVRAGELVTLPGEIWFVYIQLKNKASTVAPPKIRARALTTESQPVRYYLPRIYSLTWNAAATGITPHDFAERSPYLTIKRIHFRDDSIESVGVKRDSVVETIVSKQDNAFDLAKAGLEQNTGWFSLDFVANGFGMESRLQTAAKSQLAFEIDKTKTGAIPVLVEALEQVTPLPSQQPKKA
ncbi:major capsid protein P2 [Vibrio nigripulchritudo]|uniref:major capsid protein P2 n=1 Tax=Vibrio nigripulchritudo TaxID=28173 RepID=UPI0024929D0F|nr:major capsid protein P2 [Vibrio nigripulchritudo]BDU42891.1 membrane protein [Vibrio nigripulchritudo]